LGLPQKETDPVRKSIRGFRASQGLQAGFLGCPISLLSVASYTAGDNILPTLVPSPSHGNDVIISELAARKTLPTVLTSMMIPRIDIGSGEPDLVVVPLHRDVSKQSQNRRKPKRQRNTPNLAVIFLDDLNLFLEQHAHGTLPGNHL